MVAKFEQVAQRRGGGRSNEFAGQRGPLAGMLEEQTEAKHGNTKGQTGAEKEKHAISRAVSDQAPPGDRGGVLWCIDSCKG